MKASSFKEAPKPRKFRRSKVVDGICQATGKQALWVKFAQKRADVSDDIKGGMVAYKCPYGKTHWHVGHRAAGLDIGE